MLKPILWFLFCCSAFVIMGCQQIQNQMKVEPDDTPTSVSVDDVVPVNLPLKGTVLIGKAGDNVESDDFVLNSAMITDDTLVINVSYSGGCKAHQFTLIASDTFLESFPVQLHVSLVHDAMGDTCEAYPTEDYHFNLTPIKTMYQNAYRQETGTIILRLKDSQEGELAYIF